MRILFLLTQDLNSPSGLGRYLPMAAYLQSQGHEVRIAALHPDYQHLAEKHYQDQGLRVDYIAPMHVKKQGSRKSYYSPLALLWVVSKATIALSIAALIEPVDIIYIGKPHPMNSIAGFLGRAIHHCRLILDCDDDEANSNRFSSGWQQKVISFFERNVPHRVDLLTTNTMVTRDRLIDQGIPQKKIIFVPNGVDQNRFKNINCSEVEKIAVQYGLIGSKVVLYVGSLSLLSHPVDLLIKAFSIVVRSVENSHLVIVGGGENLEELDSQVKALGLSSKVTFCGRVSSDQVKNYYRLADVSVDPVYNDAVARSRSPLKLFESWAAGTPFVTADVGDRRSLAGDPPAAILVKPGSAQDLAQAMITILCEERTKQGLIERGYDVVKQYYWENIMKNVDIFQ